MVDAVLLEWDGVLADTGDARRDALLRALADEGVSVTATTYNTCCDGLDARSAVAAALAHAGHRDATLADLVALRASNAFVASLAHGFSLCTGAAELVSHAESRTRVAIVTRATRAETELALRLAAIEGSIGCVVTIDDVLDPPPAPELYQRAIARLAQRRGVTAERVVALVSTSAQVRAARAAGVRVLTVGAPAHVAMEADAAVTGLTDLSLDAIAMLAGVPRAVLPE